MSMSRRLRPSEYDAFLDNCKVYDFTFTQPLTVSPGYSAVYSLNQIPRGKGDGERIGREVTLKRLVLSYYTEAHNSDPSCPFVRTLLFLDTQFRGSIVTPAQVLQANSIDSPVNKYNRDRFSILFDDTQNHSISAVNGMIYEHVTPPLTRMSIDMNVRINWTSSQGADIRGNNIAMVFPVKAATNLTQMTVYARLFYVDE